MDDTGPVAVTTDTPPASIDATGALESLSASQMDTWREKGTLPDSIQITKPDDEPKPAGDDAPALDAQNKPILGADNKPLSKRQQKRDEAQRETNERIRRASEAERRAETAERRIAELEARISGQAPPAAQPKPGEQPAAQAGDDKAPVLDDYMDQPDPYVAWQAALVTHGINAALKAERETRATEARQTQAQEQLQQRVQSYQERETAFKATVPDFDARTLAFRQVLDVNDPIGRSILASEVGAQMVLHLAEHPEDVRRIGALMQTDMTAALRALWTIEKSIDPAAHAAPAVEPANQITKAPAPPTVLGDRAADAADAVESAVKRRDAGAYIREANARELAAARR